MAASNASNTNINPPNIDEETKKLTQQGLTWADKTVDPPRIDMSTWKPPSTNVSPVDIDVASFQKTIQDALNAEKKKVDENDDIARDFRKETEEKTDAYDLKYKNTNPSIEKVDKKAKEEKTQVEDFEKKIKDKIAGQNKDGTYKTGTLGAKVQEREQKIKDTYDAADALYTDAHNDLYNQTYKSAYKTTVDKDGNEKTENITTEDIDNPVEGEEEEEGKKYGLEKLNQVGRRTRAEAMTCKFWQNQVDAKVYGKIPDGETEKPDNVADVMDRIGGIDEDGNFKKDTWAYKTKEAIKEVQKDLDDKEMTTTQSYGGVNYGTVKTKKTAKEKAEELQSNISASKSNIGSIKTWSESMKSIAESIEEQIDEFCDNFNFSREDMNFTDYKYDEYGRPLYNYKYETYNIDGTVYTFEIKID